MVIVFVVGIVVVIGVVVVVVVGTGVGGCYTDRKVTKNRDVFK